MSAVRSLALVGALAALASCAAIAGLDGLQIGDCKGGIGFECAEADGGPGADGGAHDASDLDGGDLDGGGPPTAPCPSERGATMLRVGSQSNSFCIDARPATVAEYGTFLGAIGDDVSGQPAACAWNASYDRLSGGADDAPQTGIDWCDAHAYCKWAGKRLCGKRVGGSLVGPVPLGETANMTTSEWVIACTAHGQKPYPYGPTYDPTACNFGDGGGAPRAVGSMPECEGGYPGLFDMLGNVWEWYDGPCPPRDGGAGEDDDCHVKGGSFVESGDEIDCGTDGFGGSRSRRSQDTGIRCCAD